jgi:hydroxyacylglutathione hydrolase
MVLVVAPEQVDDALASLYSIGLDRIEGWVTPEALGRELDTTVQVTAKDAAAQATSGAVTVVDVRRRSEYDEGHVSGALHIPLGDVGARISEIPADRPVVLHCEGGTRSSIAASVMRALGRHDVANLQGGFTAWKKAGLPAENELAETSRTP